MSAGAGADVYCNDYGYFENGAGYMLACICACLDGMGVWVCELIRPKKILRFFMKGAYGMDDTHKMAHRRCTWALRRKAYR